MNLPNYQRGFIQIPLFGFLALAVRPLVVRIMTFLGVGLLTFTGVSTLVNQLLTNSRQNYNSLPADLLNIAGLAGIGEAFGIIAAAILVRISFSFLPRYGKLPT